MERQSGPMLVREEIEEIVSLTNTLRGLVGSLAGAVAGPMEAARELQAMESLAQVAGYGQLVAAGTARMARVEQLGERGMAASREPRDPAAVPGVPGPAVGTGGGGLGSEATGGDAPGNTWAGGAVYMDTGAFMADALRITGREARDRLAFAAAVLPRPGISGPDLPPVCPTVSAALAEGSMGTGTAGRIVRAVRKAAPAAGRVPDGHELLAAMEETTAVLAATATPVEVSRILAYWLERFDEDTEPDERTRRHFEGIFDRGTRHGLREFLLRCQPEDSETLRTVMNLFTNPRTDPAGETESRESTAASDDATPASRDADGEAKPGYAPHMDPDPSQERVPGTGGDGKRGTPGNGGSAGWKIPSEDPWDGSVSSPWATKASEAGEPAGTDGGFWSAWAAGADANGNAETSGGRGTRAQQMLRGLLAALRAALASGGMPQSGGLRPQLLVHIDYDALTGTGSGASSGTYETRMPAAEARRLACEADILPIVLSGTGEILDLGRSQRLFSAAQRKALAARDRGCAFPGCGIPAAWAEAHHIVPWQAGGGTNIANGVLLCGHHHRVIHRQDWAIEVRNGIPWFLPPDYLDPGRTSRRNLHHHPELAFEPMLPVRQT